MIVHHYKPDYEISSIGQYRCLKSHIPGKMLILYTVHVQYTQHGFDSGPSPEGFINWCFIIDVIGNFINVKM